MHVTLPNRAYLADLERFLGLIKDDGSLDLDFELRVALFSVHPIVLCMIAALGDRAHSQNGKVYLTNPQVNSSTRYLERMKRFEVMELPAGISVTAHEAAGRFIPVTRIQDNEALNNFVLDFVPPTAFEAGRGRFREVCPV